MSTTEEKDTMASYYSADMKRNLISELPEVFQSGDLNMALLSAMSRSRSTDEEFMLLVPIAAMHGVLDTLTILVPHWALRVNDHVARYLRLYQKSRRSATLPLSKPAASGAGAQTPTQTSHQHKITIEDIESFIEEAPEFAYGYRIIAEGLKLKHQLKVSPSTVGRVIKGSPGRMRKKRINIAPKHLTAQEVDSTLTYLDSLHDFFGRVRKALGPGFEPDPVMRDAIRKFSDDQRAFAQITAFADQTPIVQGGTISEVYTRHGQQVLSGGTLKGNLMGQTWILSAVITVNQTVKTWLHVDNAGRAVSVGDEEIVKFYTQEQPSPSPELSRVGGKAVGPLLQALGIKFLIVDSVGRSGATAAPVASHFSPTVFQHLAKHGVRMLLLPPAGCLGNPIELWNGAVQRHLRAWHPENPPRHRLPGVTNLEEAQRALHEFAVNHTGSGTAHKHNYDHYAKRACGDELWLGIVGEPVQHLVRKLRRRRVMQGLPIQQRSIEFADEPIEYTIHQEGGKKRCLSQSVSELVTKPAARECVKKFEQQKRNEPRGKARRPVLGKELFRLRPYLGWDRYRLSLYACNVWWVPMARSSS